MNEVTSSVMISEGRLPSCSGGMRDPLLEEGPLPGARDPFLASFPGAGDFSFEISTFGGSTNFGAPGPAYLHILSQVNTIFTTSPAPNLDEAARYSWEANRIILIDSKEHTWRWIHI